MVWAGMVVVETVVVFSTAEKSRGRKRVVMQVVVTVGVKVW